MGGLTSGTGRAHPGAEHHGERRRAAVGSGADRPAGHLAGGPRGPSRRTRAGSSSTRSSGSTWAGRCSTCCPCCRSTGATSPAPLLDLVTRGKGRRPAEVVSIIVAGGVGLVALAVGSAVRCCSGRLFVFMNISSLTRVKTEELADELNFGHRALIEHRPGRRRAGGRGGAGQEAVGRDVALGIGAARLVPAVAGRPDRGRGCRAALRPRRPRRAPASGPPQALAAGRTSRGRGGDGVGVRQRASGPVAGPGHDRRRRHRPGPGVHRRAACAWTGTRACGPPCCSGACSTTPATTGRWPR